MQLYDIRIGSRKQKALQLNEKVLFSIVDDGIKRLEEIRDINKKYAADWMRGMQKGPCYTMFGSIDRDLKHRGNFLLMANHGTLQQWEITALHAITAEIDYALNKCYEFRKYIGTQNAALPGYAVSLKASNAREDIFDTVCSPRDSCCPKCGALVTQKSLPRHIDSNMCITKATDTEMETQRNLFRTVDDALEKAVIKAGLEHERRPVAYATWVPKWAIDAAAKYKQGGGYAGMSLADYLKRMVPKPEDTE